MTIAPAATRDLAAARKWLTQDGAGAAARRTLTKLKTAVTTDLRASPCRWPPSTHPGVRERSVDGYRVMFEVDPDTGDNETAGNVEVLRVFGPGQDRSGFSH